MRNPDDLVNVRNYLQLNVNVLWPWPVWLDARQSPLFTLLMLISTFLKYVLLLMILFFYFKKIHIICSGIPWYLSRWCAPRLLFHSKMLGLLKNANFYSLRRIAIYSEIITLKILHIISIMKTSWKKMYVLIMILVRCKRLFGYPWFKTNIMKIIL